MAGIRLRKSKGRCACDDFYFSFCFRMSIRGPFSNSTWAECASCFDNWAVIINHDSDSNHFWSGLMTYSPILDPAHGVMYVHTCHSSSSRASHFGHLSYQQYAFPSLFDFHGPRYCLHDPRNHSRWAVLIDFWSSVDQIDWRRLGSKQSEQHQLNIKAMGPKANCNDSFKANILVDVDLLV